MDGSKRISDVSLDNCGDRLYFVYSKRARRGGFTLPLPPPPPPSIVDILLDRERTALRTRPRDEGARVHAKSKSRVN